MHKIPKWLWVLLITVVVVWAVLQLAVRPVIEHAAGRIIGARVTLGGFSVDVFHHQVRLDNFAIYNEEGFPPKVFFKAPEIRVEADPAEVLKGKLHFPLIVFRLDKMIIFKNMQGKLNVDELKIVREKLHDKNKGPAPNFKIDVLKLNIAQVVVEDDGKDPPLVLAYDLALKDKTLRNLDSANKLVGVILFEALKPTALQSAGMYAATALLGVGFLPGLAVGVIVAKDDETAELSHAKSDVFHKTLQLFQQLKGQIKNSDEAGGKIAAKVYDSDITVSIQDEGWNRCKITLKARKYFLAKPEIAAGLVYQLKEALP